MKSDGEIADRAPILRPSDVVHNRAPEWELDEPDHVDFPTARIGDIAVCLHFLPGSTCLITESFDGSIPTKGMDSSRQMMEGRIYSCIIPKSKPRAMPRWMKDKKSNTKLAKGKKARAPKTSRLVNGMRV